MFGNFVLMILIIVGCAVWVTAFGMGFQISDKRKARLKDHNHFRQGLQRGLDVKDVEPPDWKDERRQRRLAEHREWAKEYLQLLPKPPSLWQTEDCTCETEYLNSWSMSQQIIYPKWSCPDHGQGSDYDRQVKAIKAMKSPSIIEPPSRLRFPIERKHHG